MTCTYTKSYPFYQKINDSFYFLYTSKYTKEYYALHEGKMVDIGMGTDAYPYETKFGTKLLLLQNGEVFSLIGADGKVLPGASEVRHIKVDIEKGCYQVETDFGQYTKQLDGAKEKCFYYIKQCKNKVFGKKSHKEDTEKAGKTQGKETPKLYSVGLFCILLGLAQCHCSKVQHQKHKKETQEKSVVSHQNMPPKMLPKASGKVR